MLRDTLMDCTVRQETGLRKPRLPNLQSEEDQLRKPQLGMLQNSKEELKQIFKIVAVQGTSLFVVVGKLSVGAHTIE